MKKLLLTLSSGLVALATIGLLTSTAAAWSFGVSGSGQCQSDGSLKITWVVDNTTEKQVFKVTNSSNPAVVLVGTTVPAKSTQSFTQVADGKVPATFSLTVTGNWKGDRKNRNQTGIVKLQTACAQPQVKAVSTTAPAPTGPVNAGSGSVNGFSLAAIAGLAVSTVAAGFGLRRLNRQSR